MPTSRVLLAVALLLGACDYPERDRAIVRRWLKCEECVSRELDSVRARGDRVVPLLRQALKGPDSARTANVRRQLDSAYTRVLAQAASESRPPYLTETQFVDHYLNNYKAASQSRAITGLSAIGTRKARDALKSAIADTAQSDTIYRPDVLQQLISALDGSWTSISAGFLRTCAIMADGKSYCWGNNDQGQLGDGTTANRIEPTLVHPPHGADTSFRFLSIAVGDSGSHTCGISNGKLAFCWGDNSRTQLGDSTPTDRPIPTAVFWGIRFTGITVGGNHTCAWTPQYEAYCWGENDVGQLGIAGASSQPAPLQVFLFGPVRISAGARHTCADSLNNVLHCWGSNSNGQLGDGSTVNRLTPTQAVTSLRVSSVSVGTAHTCVLAQGTPPHIGEGDVFCTGSNDRGQLGNNSTAPESQLIKNLAPRMLALSAGDNHTCAIAIGSRAMYCWGGNESGQLGIGNTVDQLVPAKVSGNLAFLAVSAGTGHTCGIAIDGVAYCWGRNNAGQLGDTTTTERLVPVKVVRPD